MRRLLYLCMLTLLSFAFGVNAITLTDTTIILNGSSVDISGCTWEFTEIKWDIGGNWLYVESLNVDNPNVPGHTNNYSALTAAYTCTSFPYSVDWHVTDANNSFLNSLLIVASMFALFIVALFGLLVFKAFQGKMDSSELWDLAVKLTVVIIGLTIIIVILSGLRASGL